MKRLFILLLIAGLFACQPEPSTTDSSNKESAPTSAVTENVANAADEKAPPPPNPVKSEDPELGTRTSFQPPQSDDVLLLSAGSTRIKSGQTGCVDIKVKEFNNLLSMQYTLVWDAKVLKFNAVKNFGLPYISQQNFGNNRLLDGKMAFVWIDNQLKGTTLPDDSTIFSICFDALGKAGEQSAVQFTEQPTPFEVVNINEEVQKLEASPGNIIIE